MVNFKKTCTPNGLHVKLGTRKKITSPICCRWTCYFFECT